MWQRRLAAGNVDVDVGDDGVVPTVVVEVDDQVVAAEAVVAATTGVGERDRRRERHRHLAVERQLVEDVAVLTVVTDDHVRQVVVVEIADVEVVRRVAVGDLVAAEDAVGGGVVEADRDALRRVERIVLDDVHLAVVVHVDDVDLHAERRLEHFGRHAARRFVGEVAGAVVDQQTVFDVLRAATALLVVTEVEVEVAVAVDVAGVNRAKAVLTLIAPAAVVDAQHIVVEQAEPVAATVVAAVDVDARHPQVLRQAIGQRRASDDVEPGVTVDVGDDDVAVIGGVEEGRAAGHGRARQRRRAVGQHAVLVHQENVREPAGRRERLLADDDEVGVTILVEVGPRHSPSPGGRRQRVRWRRKDGCLSRSCTRPTVR